VVSLALKKIIGIGNNQILIITPSIGWDEWDDINYWLHTNCDDFYLENYWSDENGLKETMIPVRPPGIGSRAYRIMNKLITFNDKEDAIAFRLKFPLCAQYPFLN